MKIGANVKFYNYEMRAAREKLKMSQTKLAYLVGCDVHIINYIENLTRPLKDVDKLRSILFSIADVLEVDIENIFPKEYLDALVKGWFPEKMSSYILIRDIPLHLLKNTDRQLIIESTEDTFIENDKTATKIIEDILKLDLTKNENIVIRRRFRFDSTSLDNSLEGVAKTIGVTATRVRQIEAKALRRLRHPSSELRKYAKIYDTRIDQLLTDEPINL